jgi:eukaryotic-like serine/threonine-protein kinase
MPPDPPLSSEEILAAFLEVHPDPSPADIDALCAEHADHPADLRRLLTVHRAMVAAVPSTLSQDGPGLHRPLHPSATPAASGFRVSEGMTLGEFTLVRILGRGGMGEVWEAEQASLSRRVALKLLLPERVDSKGLDFFAREARAGGRLAHPGIVSIHGTGEDEGLHWIAMELVEDACDLRRSLDGIREDSERPEDYHEESARFLAEAADALEVAHAAGVIHRDLKPANILITPDDHPKISDFGLAKLTDELSLSLPGDLAGTYFYMSPEQVAAKRMGLDHRTDIFSLGVVLYEMLTLVRPFEGDTTEQVAYKILLVDPPPPNDIRSKVPRDLSVICGKAMEKEPGRRYSSMAEFAADLRRYLADEPILARPPGPIERAVKWVRRNPTPSAVMGVAAAALVVISWLGLLATSRAETLEKRGKELAEVNGSLVEQRAEAEAQARIAQENAERAEEARDRAEKVADFHSRMIMPVDQATLGDALVSSFEAGIAEQLKSTGSSEEEIEAKVAIFHDLASLAQPTDVGKKILDEEFMALTAEKIGEEFADDPRTEATLREALAKGYYHPLALFEQAEAQQKRVVMLRRETLGDEHPDTLRSIGRLGIIFKVRGKLDLALPLSREALQGIRYALGDEHPATLSAITNLGSVLMSLGRLDEAEPLMREVVEGGGRTLGESSSITLNYKNNLALLFAAQGKSTEAETLLLEVLATNGDVLGPETSFHGYVVGSLGAVVMNQGRYTDAEPYLRDAITKMLPTLGSEHPFTLQAVSNLGIVLQELGQFDEALLLEREGLEGRRRTLGNEHPNTLSSISSLGRLLANQGKFAEAETLLREALLVRRRVLGDQHPDTLETLRSLGRVEADGLPDSLKKEESATPPAEDSDQDANGDDDRGWTVAPRKNGPNLGLEGALPALP